MDAKKRIVTRKKEPLMRKKLLAQIILAGFVLVFGFTGCHHGNGAGGANGAGGNGESGVPPIGTGENGGPSDRPIVGEGGLSAHGQFAAVLFDYDSARIRPSEESKVQTVAAYLKSNPGKLVVEGHCDERGTAEYNRALGERRALAAREELVKLGADGGRITTISYGSERPVDTGHDESAWSKNRRDEFVVVNQ
jgi:peptidoglycan-associated lipoprotein